MSGLEFDKYLPRYELLSLGFLLGRLVWYTVTILFSISFSQEEVGLLLEEVHRKVTKENQE